MFKNYNESLTVVFNLAKTAVLFTGGKDSTFALHRAVEAGLDVCVLVSIIPHYNYSPLYHKPFFEGVKCQAYALRLPLETIGVYSESAEKYALINVLKRVREKYKVEVLVTGAVKSRFQERVFREIANTVGLELYNPLWGISEEDYLEKLLEYGVEFMLISITSMGIPLSLLGKVLGYSDVVRLKSLAVKYGFNLSFEGGDAETFVVNAPLFKYRVAVKGRSVVVSEYEGYFVISKCGLVEKY